MKKQSASKNRVYASAFDDDDDDDDEVTILSPAKKERMELPKKANTSTIKIEQWVKHDVWDIRKKNDGAFIMKKTEENTGASTARAEPSGNVSITVNTVQTGARPKLVVCAPKSNTVLTVNAGNTPKAVDVPQKTEVINVPKIMRNVATADSASFPVVSFNINPSSSQKKVITLNTKAAPTKTISINTSAPKKDVITINTLTSPKKEVITIDTSAPKKNEAASAQAINAQNKENTAMNKSSGEPSLIDVSGSDNEDISMVYAEEAYRVLEIFPDLPLNIIMDDLRTSGSSEATVNNILNGSLSATEPPVAPTPAKQSRNAEVPKQSAVSQSNVSDVRKGSSVIKIELQAKNEVWDIRKKEREGYVMKKLVPDEGGGLEKSVGGAYASSTVVLEDYSEELDDEGLLAFRANSSQEWKAYSQTSTKAALNEDPSVTRNEKIPSMIFDNDAEWKMSVDSFEFSDDENAVGETVELFLFKGALGLRKLKYFNEKEDQEVPNDSAMLNITGSAKTNEELIDSGTSEVISEDCDGDGSHSGGGGGGDDDEDFYTDEYESSEDI